MKNQVKIANVIKPFKRKKIFVSSDKSLSIRCVLLSSIAVGRSKIFNLLESEDVINSLKIIKKLGVNYKKNKDYFEIFGVGIGGYDVKNNTILDAGNSGTLARCILGLLSSLDKNIKLIGDRSLSRRDFIRVIRPLNLFGVKTKSLNGKLPLEIKGTKLLRPINFYENKASAQVKTCVIFSAMNTPGITKIKAKKIKKSYRAIIKIPKLSN